ncbi:hypothetical protein LTR85_010037 [Meristemomyces frigidus]|nr:hypothetical protein LTR85_010037 [Meristemomyces frigidus]
MAGSASAAAKQHDPLRVLFCGADEFSIYSLRALHELQKKRTDKVESIDVVCRPDKRVGRGMKQIQEVPIKGVATELGLKLHQIDTFQDWVPPTSFNLIVAVSFGLLVPARIIESAKYGGLNVHPSLLPEFRGAAPIQHTLLHRRTRSGVTLQTMHPTKFDHGMVLDQSRVDLPPDSQYQDLVGLLGPLGAKMLAKCIYHGNFVPPLQEAKGLRGLKASYAPKLTPEDRHINWDTWTADDIITRDKVIGRLWDTTTYTWCMGLPPHEGQARRLTYHGPWVVHPKGDSYPETAVEANAGSPLPLTDSRPARIGFCTVDKRLIMPSEVTIEGERRAEGLQKLAQNLLQNHGEPLHNDLVSATPAFALSSAACTLSNPLSTASGFGRHISRPPSDADVMKCSQTMKDKSPRPSMCLALTWSGKSNGDDGGGFHENAPGLLEGVDWVNGDRIVSDEDVVKTSHWHSTFPTLGVAPALSH